LFKLMRRITLLIFREGSARNDQQHPRNLLFLDDGRNLRECSDRRDNSDFDAGGSPMQLITAFRKAIQSLITILHET
jgi:hypothetical protein